MEYFGKAEYGTDDIFYVLPFVVGRDNYDAVRCLHINSIKFRNKSSFFPLVMDRTKDYLTWRHVRMYCTMVFKVLMDVPVSINGKLFPY